MGGKGRPRKPDKLKKLEGTFRDDRDRSNDVPKFPSVIDPGIAPVWFNEMQVEQFEIITSELIRVNLMESIDINLVVAYCVEISNYYHAAQKINDNYTIFNKGKISINPYFKIKNESLTNALRIGSKFGFSPADRQKLITKKLTDTDNDPLINEI